jgi:hypothetical protein
MIDGVPTPPTRPGSVTTSTMSTKALSQNGGVQGAPGVEDDSLRAQDFAYAGQRQA